MSSDGLPLDFVVSRQHRVVTRDQLLAANVTPGRIRARLDARRWRQLHPGVYVTHDGPVDWMTRAWAAVLASGPGARLALDSAAYVDGMVAKAPHVLDVTIPHDRRVQPPRGVRLHRSRRVTDPAGDPPRTWMWETAVDLADAAPSEDAVVSVLAEAARVHTPMSMLRREVASRSRLHHRALIDAVLREVRDGVESPLELRYVRRVERAHGLPRSRRQVPAAVAGIRLRTDVLHEAFATRVELDGELAHPGGATDADLWRDNVMVLGHSGVTLRYRWWHVVGRACGCAAQVTLGLRRGGWRGQPRACRSDCSLADELRLYDAGGA